MSLACLSFSIQLYKQISSLHTHQPVTNEPDVVDEWKFPNARLLVSKNYQSIERHPQQSVCEHHCQYHFGHLWKKWEEKTFLVTDIYNCLVTNSMRGTRSHGMLIRHDMCHVDEEKDNQTENDASIVSWNATFLCALWCYIKKAMNKQKRIRLLRQYQSRKSKWFMSR